MSKIVEVIVADGSIINYIKENAEVIRHLARTMLPIERLVTGAAYVMGISFAVKAIYTLKNYGEARSMMSSNTSIKEPIFYFLVAGMLIFFPSALDMMLTTTFGQPGILSYHSISSQSKLISLFQGSTGAALTRIMQVIGTIAFIRGWVLLARSAGHGQQPGGTGKALMHIFGGVLAINIVATLEIINNTLYGV